MLDHALDFPWQHDMQAHTEPAGFLEDIWGEKMMKRENSLNDEKSHNILQQWSWQCNNFAKQKSIALYYCRPVLTLISSSNFKTLLLMKGFNENGWTFPKDNATWHFKIPKQLARTCSGLIPGNVLMTEGIISVQVADCWLSHSYTCLWRSQWDRACVSSDPELSHHLSQRCSNLRRDLLSPCLWGEELGQWDDHAPAGD